MYPLFLLFGSLLIFLEIIKWIGFNEINVYRGSKEDEYYNALSWTTDIDVARKFAHRFTDNGTVYSTKIKKADILAYFEAEEEVVVNYKRIKDVEIIG